MGSCDNDELIMYWCVDFSDSPEYNPKTSGNPDFMISVSGDSTINYNLQDVSTSFYLQTKHF